MYFSEKYLSSYTFGSGNINTLYVCSGHHGCTSSDPAGTSHILILSDNARLNQYIRLTQGYYGPLLLGRVSEGCKGTIKVSDMAKFYFAYRAPENSQLPHNLIKQTLVWEKIVYHMRK